MMLFSRVRVQAGALALLAALPGVASAQADCQRPAARAFQPGEVVVLKDPAHFPCRIQFTDTHIELRTDIAGKVPAIVGNPHRAPDGRFVAATGRGTISVWNADGTFAKSVGRSGRGSGELAPGALTMEFDRGGRLFVRDNSDRWSIFSPALEFQRTVSSAGMGGESARSEFLDNGEFLTASLISGHLDTYFKIYDFSRTEKRTLPSGRGGADAPMGPVLVRSFGAVSPKEGALPPKTRERFISYSGGATFWAGPPAAASRGYELELWSTNGIRLRTLRREVSWYPPGADAPPGKIVRGQPPPRQPAQIVTFHEDGSGLLYVGVFVPNAKWGPIPTNVSAAERTARMDAMADMHIEVIDANAGVVLASSGAITRSRALRDFTVGLFSGTHKGYRPSEATGFLPGVRIVEYKLVAQ